MTALYPAIFAIDDNASNVWALVVRGIWSIAKDVIFFYFNFWTISLFWPGWMKEITVDPGLITSNSSLFKVGLNCGILTFKTTSASRAYFVETILAPEFT